MYVRKMITDTEYPIGIPCTLFNEMPARFHHIRAPHVTLTSRGRIVSAGFSILKRCYVAVSRLSALQLRGDAGNYEHNPLRFTWKTCARGAGTPGF